MSHAFLEVHQGRQVSQVSLESGRLMIGRQAGCDLVIDDTQASRSHCLIERTGNEYLLRDLQSKNGTRVNGQLITTCVLSAGDVISIGTVEMRFVNPDAAEQEADVLSDADLVEVDGEESSTPGLVGFVIKGGDYEGGLEKLAEALPDKTFTESDIELINARGGTVHHAGQQRRPGRREAVDIFRLLLLVCFRSRASDIHVEPRNSGHQVRLRIDGTMVDVMNVPNQFGVKLTTLVKVLSDIDIAQRSSIQEGHFASKVPFPKKPGAKRRVDYRVSFAPALFGQKLVIRILDTANAPLRVGDLQLPAWMYEEIGSAIRQDSGMVMVAGPTGSGKTTSLYALVRSIEATRRNIVTIEDPVEIQLENVTQIPVDEAHEKGFSQLLRSVLRQDPDVLLVGEIRDAETARIAMQAAITGHLVFSTVHTKDTIGTIFRLLDLGVEPYLVGQGLHLVLAQRLVRRLCPYCKKPANPTPEQRAVMGEMAANLVKIFVPHGCQRCLGTGFSGRQAFFELLRVNDELRDLILRSPTMQEIQAILNKGRFVKLQHSAYELVVQGISPFEEVERMVGREK